MRQKKTNSVLIGLDIGAGAIKYALVRAPELGEEDDYMVLDVKQEPIDPGALVAGAITDPGKVVAGLKELAEKHDIAGARVNFSIANPEVYLSLFAAPIGDNESEVEVELQVANAVQDAFSELHKMGKLVYERAELAASAKKRYFQLLAVREEMVMSYFNAIRKAGFQPVFCEFAPVAEARTVRIARDPRGDVNHMVVNIGATKTIFLVRSGTEVLFYHVIPLGGDNITRAVAEKIGLSMADAEKAKRLVGLLPQQHPNPQISAQIAAAQSAMQEVVDQMTNELISARSLYESDDDQEGKPLSTLTVLGGGARLPGLAEEFGKYLQMPVADLKAAPGFDDVEELDIFATALGLAAAQKMSLLPAKARGAVSAKVDMKRAEKDAKRLSGRSAATNPILYGILLGFLAIMGCYYYGNKLNGEPLPTPPPPPVTTTPTTTQYTGSYATPGVQKLAQILPHQSAVSFLGAVDRLVSTNQVRDPRVTLSDGVVSFSGEITDTNAYDTLKGDLADPSLNLTVQSATSTAASDGLTAFQFTLAPKTQGQ